MEISHLKVPHGCLIPGLQARTVEKPDTIVTGAGDGGPETNVDIERLEYASIEGPGPVLAYMAENKSHVSSH